MTTEQKPLFLIPEIPLLFSAIGCMWGSFQVDENQKKSLFLKGILKTKDGREFLASVRKPNWKRWVKTGIINPESRNYWRVYFKTTKEGIINDIQLLRVIKRTFPVEIEPQGDTLEDYSDLFRIRGHIAEISSEAFSIKIGRNEFPNEDRPYLKNFYLNIKGELRAEAQPKQFWEIMCMREGESLKLIKGTLITEELINNWDKELEKQDNLLLSFSGNTHKANQHQTSNKYPLEPTERERTTIMINGKQPEITVKFTERPEVPVQGKKVSLQVTGENGIVVKAALNRKTLKKQVEKMDSFTNWVAALSGKIVSISPEGVIELEAAGVNVFEKKQKVADTSSSTENQTKEDQTEEDQTVCNQATSTQTPEPEPKPVERTKKTFRLVK